MITLSSAASDYIPLLLLAAACGFIGGIAAELLLPHDKQTGLIVTPHRVPGGNLWDIGLFAPMILGAIAAVGALYFFPPVVQVKNGNTVTSSYDLVKVVALSLIIGSSGAAFLRAMQDRALKLLNQQKLQDTAAAANEQVKAVARKGAAKAGEATQAALASLQPQILKLINDAAATAPPALADALTRAGGTGTSVTLEARRDPANELLDLSVEGRPAGSVSLLPDAVGAAAEARVRDLIAQAAQQAEEQVNKSTQADVEQATATINAISNPVSAE